MDPFGRYRWIYDTTSWCAAHLHAVVLVGGFYCLEDDAYSAKHGMTLSCGVIRSLIQRECFKMNCE